LPYAPIAGIGFVRRKELPAAVARRFVEGNGLTMLTPRKLAAAFVKRTSPRLWHLLVYKRFVRSPQAERELNIIDRFIDRDRAALDIGVDLGIYTRHFAKFSRRVIAFEANPDSAAAATRFLGRSATIHWVALSSTNGVGQLRIPLRAGKLTTALGTVSAANSLGNAASITIEVPLRQLDDFALPSVGFIKIDVEGHEEDVLLGAQSLIARDRPALMVEVEERHNPGSIERVTRFFQSRGYRGFFFDGSALRSIAMLDPKVHQSLGRKPYIHNFFFCPTEFDIRSTGIRVAEGQIAG
jgi:FkbM family methyltransferase